MSTSDNIILAIRINYVIVYKKFIIAYILGSSAMTYDSLNLSVINIVNVVHFHVLSLFERDHHSWVTVALTDRITTSLTVLFACVSEIEETSERSDFDLISLVYETGN